MAMRAHLAPSPLTPHDLSVNDYSVGGDSVYELVGNDPQLVFGGPISPVSGRDAGLLRFEFSCVGKNAEPRIQLYWWGDEQAGANEDASLKFTADDGGLIVPLDAYPRWLLLDEIHGVRIDLHNQTACEAISVKNVSLQQREAFH